LRPSMWLKILKSLDYKSLFMWWDDSTVSVNNSIVESLILRTYGARLLRDALDVCREIGMKPFLIYGTLLGHLRDKGFIEHDWDVDLGLLEEDIPKRGLLTKGMEERGHVFDNETEHGIIFRDETSPLHLDLWYFFREGDSMVTRIHNREKNELYTFTFSRDIFDSFEKARFLDTIEVLIPCKPEKFLTEHYGDWRTPRGEMEPWEYNNITITKKAANG